MTLKDRTCLSMFKSLVIRRRKPAQTLLQGLLPEMVEVVALFLEPADMCALRMTCRSLYNKTYIVFWRTSLRNIQTDLSHASPKKLEVLSNDPQLRRYVHHLTFKGFDEDSYILGEGLEWNRHPSGHLINLQDQPAVKLLRPILCRLVNCKSFECWSYSTPDHPDLEPIARTTDAVQVFLDIVSETRLPVASFSVNFRPYGSTGNNYLDPRRLHPGYFTKAGFVDVWAQLEKLILDFNSDFEIILNWATDLIRLAPNVKKLDMRLDEPDNAFILIQRLATDSFVWPRLQELRLDYISSKIACLTAVLHKCQQTLRVLCIGDLIIDASVADLRLLFQILSRQFPYLGKVNFGAWWSRGTGMPSALVVHYPGFLDNLNMDETEKARVRVVYRGMKGRRRARVVAYSGPQVRVVLDTLAISVELA
ncbi:uncharacterized protein APUU_20088S [Aspergillus puulaauensis]|uniref:F-box domain-containing protein n=1 Tax=Aspergillus puulaauensis TaxID=1220207 RepID=A0A7R7XEE4_9EURO|nr:uncharacterized protein APUU_20088S [Aspergillus puulaauensis]BCS19656.1 hypothetical protein APUU_20088S [Aspergillus puulaauensis]